MSSQIFNIYSSGDGSKATSLAKINSLSGTDQYDSLIFDTKRHTIWAKGEEYGSGEDTVSISKKWTASIKCATWSRLCFIPYNTSTSGSSYIIQIQATRSSVVYNDTFFVTATHAAEGVRGQITKISGSLYTDIKVRIVVDSPGNSYFEIYDNGNNATNSTTQTVYCSLIGIRIGDIQSSNLYTSFVDGSTLPTNYTVQHTLNTSSAAIDARSIVLEPKSAGNNIISIRRPSDSQINFVINTSTTSDDEYRFNATGGASSFSFYTNTNSTVSEKLKISNPGHLLPGTTDSQNIGSTSLFWHHLYTNNIYLNRASNASYGRISFYSPSYYTWFEYMSNVGNASPTGAAEVAGTYVSAWARRSLIENASGYGWVWESTTNATNSVPDIKMELSSNTGNLWVKSIGNFNTVTVRVATGTAPFSIISTTLNTNLNADLLDGLHAHTGGDNVVNNSANKIIRTDQNGYTRLGWIETSSGNFTGTPTRIYASNDGFIRYMTPANFFPTLVNSGNNISITVGGQNRTLTVAFATASSYVNVNYSRGDSSPSNSGAWSAIKNGKTNPVSARAQFWTVYNDGGPTSYGDVIEILSANVNHWQPQLWFEGGASGSLYHRNKNYNDDTWGSWYKILDTGNLSSHAFIGTTPVQTSAQNQALTGITTINGRLSVNAESDNTRLGFGGVHGVTFGEPGYAHRIYYFRPAYGASGVTETNVYIQNASAAASPTFTTTHSFSSGGVAYHSSKLGIGTTSPTQALDVRGLLYISNSGVNGTIGPQNGSWFHFTTSAPVYFGQTAAINGNFYPYTNNAYTLGTNDNRWNTLYLKGTVNYIMDADTSNYKSPLSITNTSNTQVAEIGYHNTGDTNGALILVPYPHSGTNSWGGTIGLYIGKNTLKWENKTIWHTGNFNPANYHPLNGKITRAGGSYNWYAIQQYDSNDANPSYFSADCAIININSYSGWQPWIRAVDSEKGSWTIGQYTTNFHIGYIPKSNTTNNLTRNWTFTKDGITNFPGSINVSGSVTATGAPGFYSSVTAGWSYVRLQSGDNFWDIGTNSSDGGFGSNAGFGIRQNGASNNGIYVRRDTSSYGKLAIGVPSGECSIGYFVGGTAKWTVGCSDGTNFGWYQGSSGGWKMILDTSGNLGIGTTSPSYKLHVVGDSYTTGWSRAEAGFYCEGYGVHYYHNGNNGNIYIQSSNEMCIGSNSTNFYINYRASAHGTTATNYIWNAGSATSWATHKMGNLHIFSQTGGNYNEDIRLHANSNNWTTIVFCGPDNTGDSGTSAKTWLLGNYDGTLYINLNGSNNGTNGRAMATSTGWTFGNTSRNSYALNAASFICDSWVRTVGATGWYNESYGGGWYMNDSTYVRIYGSKYLYTTYQYYDVANEDYTIDHVYASNDRYIRPMAFSTFGYKLRDSGYLDGRFLQYNGWWTSGNGNNADNANGMVFAYANHNVPHGWGILTTFDYQYNSGYKMQLFSDGYNNGYTYYRNRSSDRGGWTSWVRFLDSANYTEYTVTKTGGGASGTWGISISGNADTVDGYHIVVGSVGNAANTIYIL